MGRLISREALARGAQREFEEAVAAARDNGTLVSLDDPRTKRLQDTLARLRPFGRLFNAEASQWNWQLAVIDDRQVNAFCGPGGYIRVHTGILELPENELAFVLGHEMAHALREHGRADWGKYVIGRVSAANTERIGSRL
jgi:Zn-dependent protease with chaperone function